MNIEKDLVEHVKASKELRDDMDDLDGHFDNLEESVVQCFRDMGKSEKEIESLKKEAWRAADRFVKGDSNE